MSIRAHRINKIEFEQGESFNLSHDEELIDWLDRETERGLFSRLNDDCCGDAEFSVEELEQAVNHFTEAGKAEVVEGLVKDIAWAKENGKDYIDYNCF